MPVLSVVPAVVAVSGLRLLLAVLFAIVLSGAWPAALAAAERLSLPPALAARAQLEYGERDGWWEKTLVVSFSGERRMLSTSDGLLSGRAAINHAAHPRLWRQLGGQARRYDAAVRLRQAARLNLPSTAVAQMATAADMDNLAVVTRQHGPLTVSVLATAGARSNAQRTGVDQGSHIEGLAPEETPAGTINIIVLSNIELSDAALARALITVTEGKTAALQDLAVPSTYTPQAQATGTGTDSIIVVSGTAAPLASYTGGHSRIGELIGKATYQAVVEALGKQNGFYLPGTLRFAPSADPAAASTVPGQTLSAKAAGDLRLALLHFNPQPGAIAANRQGIEAGIREAVRQGADWVVTPELAESGYNFASRIGTDWIEPFPSAWLHRLAAIARDNRVALFIGFAERDKLADTLHNSVAAIDRDGRILGSYRKQRVHGGAESWSQAGSGGAPFVVDGIAVGTPICADTWVPGPAARLAGQGAQILLSPANWPPVNGMGPGDVWERRSEETGLPLIVVNRGGSEPELDFSRGESVVAQDGQRLFSFQAANGGIFFIDWDRRDGFRRVGGE